MYPVLMAADILMFKSHKIPVGRDQIQHIEMARDMASSFNHLYGEHFVLPEAAIEESVATLPGLDGRKMSKSYDNTIPLFAPPRAAAQAHHGHRHRLARTGRAERNRRLGAVPDLPGLCQRERKPPRCAGLCRGIAWGDAKQMLFERIEREVAPMRERYEALIAHPDRIEATLLAGAEKARQLAAPFMRELRQAVGLRALNQQAGVRAAARADKTALPAFKQYREKDGQFYFKLVDPKGTVLLQSTGYASPRDAGQAIARLQGEGPAALTALAPNLAPVQGVTSADIEQALQVLLDAADA
jgi:tryptophanyl-tRNA synthetase